jgi:dTDP-4-dehydrorhamnose 3,5-epimerase
MRLEVEQTDIDDVLILTPQVFRDDRGFFLEGYRQDTFREIGLPDSFVQLNHSGSARDVVRGLHFQWEPPMGKLMRVVAGKAFLVAVDIRKGSRTLGRWVGTTVTPEDRRMVWAPPGCARGFAALEDGTEVEYLCTATYNAAGEAGIRWDDPQIGIAWPVRHPILSSKDAEAQTLAQWLERPQSDQFALELAR